MSYEVPKAELRDHDVYEYRDSTSLTQWTLWLLYAEIAVCLLAVASGFAERGTLHALDSGIFETNEAAAQAAQSNDSRQGLVSVCQMLVFIIGGVLTLRWIHRMCHNALVKASTMQFTPGWSIGWYFIPIANLWKPFQAMGEIWDKSQQQAGTSGREPGGLLGLWWTLWLGYSFLSNAAVRLSMSVNDIDSALTANALTVASDILIVPLCIVFIFIVKRLSAMQEYAHEHPLDPATQGIPGANW